MTELAIGQQVPDFTLPSASGEQVSLSDYSGKKVVLYFYPKDMTPTCTKESCDFRDAHPSFGEAGAVVLGISPDNVKSHRKFADKHELPFPLLADTEHKVSELFGVWQLKKMFGREYMGVVRSTFLIDEQGKLAKAWRGVKVAGHTQAVLESVNSL
ncbi:thioredoxin-dependent thiol peroxidase [Paenibacillus beijingensis]|uniref:thioredoxin-dependent peroxiredoxin n=1 Tax=Paenibacillus beijingensis TaxID=1126833 RepID=A0A0D5NGH7_9BACL|nr:thioredoxin-dependent thiol peroxidase [Paenibacillus beijingensis]AJY74366.1 peroxiredoxin [Paenibacillus beijingensis]